MALESLLLIGNHFSVLGSSFPFVKKFLTDITPDFFYKRKSFVFYGEVAFQVKYYGSGEARRTHNFHKDLNVNREEN